MLKNRRKLIFVIVCMVLVPMLSFIPAHRYYMSLTEVRINTGKHTLDVSSKLFADDLEAALEKMSGKKVSLDKSTGDKAVEGIINDYFAKNFKINVGGKLQRLNFVGFEIENDAVWCYLETPDFKGKGTVSIYNTLLYESFPDQSNLMNVSWNDVAKSARLNNPEQLGEFVFE
ncbi:MAG: DUF6702 family protein [Bacteroidia bacterium]